jgi:hypothetical protein
LATIRSTGWKSGLLADFELRVGAGDRFLAAIGVSEDSGIGDHCNS